MMIAARNAFLMGGAKLPYDAEVEYLESTGTQWLGTGVTPTTATGFSVTFYATTKGSYIFGTGNNWNTNIFALLIATSASDNYGAYLKISNRYARSSRPAANRILSAGYMPNTFSVDGETYTIQAYSSVFIGPITVFALSGDSRVSSGVRVYALALYSGSDIVRDYIPVRVGSGSSAVGYLYDRANPTGGPLGNGLYPNAGTGAFVIGPDK